MTEPSSLLIAVGADPGIDLPARVRPSAHRDTGVAAVALPQYIVLQTCSYVVKSEIQKELRCKCSSR